MLKTAMQAVDTLEAQDNARNRESLRAAAVANAVALAISQRQKLNTPVWTDVDVRAFDALRRTLSMVAGEMKSSDPFVEAPGSRREDLHLVSAETVGIDAVVKATELAP